MEILVFVLVFFKLNLVLTDDNVENTVTPKANPNINIAQESNDFLNDQLAESSQSITQAYGNAVVSDTLKETHDHSQDQAHLSEEIATTGSAIQFPNGVRSDAIPLNPLQVVQPDLKQHAHQLYLQYPSQQVQIFGAEASPLQQTHGSGGLQALGYSSYIEHLSEKDEEEIKSSLREGSLSDIKRLVPKSGISFKIYQSDKNVEKQDPLIQSSLPNHFKNSADLSVLHHRVRTEVPTSLPNQAEVYQSPLLEKLQQSPVKNGNGVEHHDSEYSQQLLQSQGQTQQNLNARPVYYAQSGTYKTISEVDEKRFPVSKPYFRINVAESNYNKQTTAPAELHRNLNSPRKSSKQIFSASNRNLNGQIGALPKAVKPVKTSESSHYAVNALQTEDKGFSYQQNHGSKLAAHSLNNLKSEDSFVEAAKHDPGNYPSDPYVPKINQKHFIGQFANAVHSDQKVVVNLPSEGAEETKSGQVITHLTTTAYPDDAFKNGRFATLAESTVAKSGLHSFISSIPKSSYVEAKNSNNFDHQKALEGSTPFDIKNAIDGSVSLHQTNFLRPTASEIHSLENLQEKPLTYIIPKIPTSTVIVDNGIHDSVTDDHQIKNFGHAGLRTPTPQLSYHTPVEVGTKFYHAPQTLLWSSEYIKQGNALTSKDLHQQLLRLHLPKEEVYVKTPTVEFPVGIVSQVSIPQQKQPLAFHYDFPIIKTIPQDFHLQSKAKTRVQSNPITYFKPGQPIAIDWSMFKSGSPNFGISPVAVKPELASHVQESGKKKIVPILVRKRKNRSNSKQEIGIIYGKVNANRRPKKPNHRQEKNIRGNLLPETSNNGKHPEVKEERKKEFSVSASYTVDRSSKSS